MPDLRDVQLLFWHAIAARPGPCPSTPPPADLGRVLLPGPQLDATERLRIYAGMYFSRLVEVLREDYPRVAAVIGPEAFEHLVSGYLAEHPSTHPSVRHLGRRFAAFLSTRAPADPPFLADLARLEWARVDVFDAPDAACLRAADVAALAPEAWAELRLAPVPALQILPLDWPVHRVWDGAERTDAEPTVLRVWRDGFLVYHASMDALETAALARVTDGTTFGDVCELCECAEEAGALLARWLEDGLLIRL